MPNGGFHTVSGPNGSPDVLAHGLGILGGWFWQSGFDKQPVEDVERIRDNNFRATDGESIRS